ncbi:hypothetical protein P3X46_002858 [Hevea brasiliensis]|uniref:Alpha-1,4 glucan phosphorylase n=1 Tax=Hevea brasiliensis TaxID=3981 RepID=A0ABQ9N705_HEVBR|nr:hypothetical protein P3X46_002858 [Hevea brasiliensis]
MATLPFPAAQAKSKFPSRFTYFNYRASHYKRNLSIKNIASDQRQEVQDPVTQGDSLDTFAPDSGAIASSIKYHAEFTPSFSPEHFELPKAYMATAESVRDLLIINWNATFEYYEKMNVKQANYLSMEFLQGRALLYAIGNLELTGAYAEDLRKLGHNLEDVAIQPDAALGNGGLGRLASCFLDSLATLNYPAWGYGLRYKCGLFKQLIKKDGQEEVAESWLEMGNPWEIVGNDISYLVKFYGKVILKPDGSKQWIGGENITAVAYDVPIPGYKTKTTINLRLWSTKVAPEEFDLRAFNAGDHAKAYAATKNAEKICYILCPGDESIEGKTLRLKQQYTLCSASLKDIIAHFERRSGESVKWEIFPDKVAVLMNDTHPTLCVPETVAYTNHTVLPEALEKWSLDLLQELLPRHVEIIKMIDKELIHTIIEEYGTEDLDLLHQKLKEMRNHDNVYSSVDATEDVDEVEGPDEETESTKEEEPTKEEEEEEENDVKFEADPALPKIVRMAHLCIVGGYAVNGVAEIHSEIVKNEVFNEFYKCFHGNEILFQGISTSIAFWRLWPEKFQNKTNGVTPRRWIRFCNPDLSKIITKWTGTEDWVLSAENLNKLRKLADIENLQSEWREAKRRNKMKVATFLKEKTGYTVNPDAMFDAQVKRIHEDKRQLLNLLGIVYRYKKTKEMSPEERQARYVPRVVFVPDYNVSVAEVLIPGSDLSQHISTAGMEASGTSHMKFAMNGCVLIGNLDGANVEIRQKVGEDNFFLFGARADEIAGLRKERAEGKFVPDPRFEEVKAFVRCGVFCPYDYEELMGSLEGNEGYGRADYFLVGKDFPSYLECQEKVDEAYRDQKRWTEMSILNTAGSYKFSSDRTVHEYARDIWRIDPVVLP